LDEEAGLIAEHYAEGNQPDLAAKYARLAGQRAMRLAAWKAAIGFFRQALAATPVADQAELLLALGMAQLQTGELAAAEESLRTALPMPATQRQPAILRAVLRSLGESLILQARYPAVKELAQSYAGHADPTIRTVAEFMWGASLSLEGVGLDEAVRHLIAGREAAKESAASEREIAQADFELGNIAAQQGRLAEAIDYYKNVLAHSPLDDGAGSSSGKEISEQERDQALRSHTLALNNLAYHLMLMGDPDAGDYIEQAIALAQEKGMLSVYAYLYSTQGEIALAREDFTAAGNAFQRALAYAQRLNQPERIAGIIANLGLLALAQGKNEVAIQRLSSARTQADAISSRFLAAQIRLWLAPLVDPATADTLLHEAQEIINAGHYYRLQPQLERLETDLAAR
jgi:tetratricopeptide (TPR) repeat protein